MGKDERLYITLDAYRAGYLTLNGHKPSFIDQGKKFIFAFPLSEKLIQDNYEYENGAVVDALRFSLAIKALKTQIYSLRG